MAKISEEARKKYTQKINEYKKIINNILEKEKAVALKLKKGNLEQNIQRFQLAEMNLNLISYYVFMNTLSVNLLSVKYESGLNNARKCCYKVLIYLEEIVSRYIDIPFSEYEEGLYSINMISEIKKYNLIKKLGFSISLVENGYGENSKWKWAFVDIKGRFAVVTKNLINFKTVFLKMDPRAEGYREVQEHLDLAKQLLSESADRYREKYELSTRRIDDMQLGINYLSGLKRIHTLLGENDKAEIAKKKLEIWKNKLESDIKENKRKQRRI